MEKVIEKIESSQDLFKTRMESIASEGGLSKEIYIRFLSCQYHLTKGVQKHFYRIASHSNMARRKQLREWLVQFAKEEEFHFDIARKDLENLGEKPLPILFDIKLWWLYFDSIIDENPFIRLGATCILENISNKSSDVIDSLLKESDYLNPQNIRFLTIHRHGPNLDHGNQIVEMLKEADLNQDEINDVLKGCEYATAFYMRFMNWMISGKIQ